MEKNLAVEKESSLNVNGRIVKFIEFEYAQEGDFVKVCTDNHDLGVAAEYAWFKNKYHNAIRTKQRFTGIILNGNKIKCDILTVKTSENETKDIYFDISQMMEDLENQISAKPIFSHDRLIAALKKTINNQINDGGELELYFPYPRHIPKSDPQWRPQLFEYSASDIDEAFSAFDETDLAKVITLRLYGNKLKKLPESVRRLKNLTELALFSTDIKRLPEWFGELSTLERLCIKDIELL